MLYDILKSIGQLYDEPMAEAKKRLDSLVKPAGSLGVMEEIICRIAGIRGEAYPSIDKKTVVIMCSITGWWKKGYFLPQGSLHVLQAACLKDATITHTACRAGINVVDIGLDSDLDCEGLLNHKIRREPGILQRVPQ